MVLLEKEGGRGERDHVCLFCLAGNKGWAVYIVIGVFLTISKSKIC